MSVIYLDVALHFITLVFFTGKWQPFAFQGHQLDLELVLQGHPITHSRQLIRYTTHLPPTICALWRILPLAIVFIKIYIYLLTLWASAASLTGIKLCFLCFCESRQIRQTSCWSSWQKSFSFSLCRLQMSLEFALWLLSCLNASDRFLSARLRGGSPIGKISLQTGHEWSLLCLHHSWRQDLQKLWPQNNTTGSLKISQHTGQVHSTSDSDAFAAIPLISPEAVESFLSRTNNFTFTFTDLLLFAQPELRFGTFWSKFFKQTLLNSQ